MNRPRIAPAGDSTLLIEFEARIDPAVNERAIRLAGRLRAAAVAGVRDVVATYRSVALFFDPLRTNYSQLLEHVEQEANRMEDSSPEPRPPLRVPVCYGGEFGPDLEGVATEARVSPEQFVSIHSSGLYRVFMLGFLPGFAYMGLVDPRIAAPRRATPRLRVAPGSVGIAGRQTGIYPGAAPSGWQIVGRTPVQLFDLNRPSPFFFAAGDAVQFVPVARSEFDRLARLRPDDARPLEPQPARDPEGVRSRLQVISPGLLTTVQDLGRWGFQSTGVSVAGPMDTHAHRLANALVGNAAADATLELTIVGPELECDDERVMAMTGAEIELTVDERPVPMHTAVALPARSRLRCGRRHRGARAYLAISGGIDVPPVFGSRSTHVASAVGGLDGRALRAGDVLPLGRRGGGGGERLAAAGQDAPGFVADRPAQSQSVESQLPNGHALVRVLPGPHQHSFTDDALALLQASPFRIDSRSDRRGFRLVGAALPQAPRAEMISDVTPMGALQVPSSGQPILLMADRQTSGGYPIIATVITADLGVAGQLAPGDSISFIVCSRAEAMSALIARERQILAISGSEPA